MRARDGTRAEAHWAEEEKPLANHALKEGELYHGYLCQRRVGDPRVLSRSRVGKVWGARRASSAANAQNGTRGNKKQPHVIVVTACEEHFLIP
jgi:hypothetical protein